MKILFLAVTSSMLFVNLGLNLFAIILISNRIRAESREITSNETLSSLLSLVNEPNQAEKRSLLDLLLAKNESINFQDPCSSNPCENNGICIQSYKDVQCICLEPFAGKRCEIGPPCLPNPCKNGGTCVVQGTESVCVCADEFDGKHCEEVTDSHSSFSPATASPSYRWSSPGYSTGYFRSSPASPSYRWSSPGYSTGYFRSSSASPSYRWSSPSYSPSFFRSSTSSPSYRWSTPACSCGDKSLQCYFNTYGQKKCVCLPGYAQIQEICSDCYCGSQSLSCRFNSTGDKICECKSGYSQKDRTCAEMCVFDSDCLNGGFCKPSKNGSFCECKTHFSGDRCEKSIMCNVLAERCLAIDAVCIQRKGKAGCECPPDKVFTLRSGNCEDICDSTKCVHGRCEIIGKSYRCSCEEGFSGFRCDERSGTSNKMSFMLIIAAALCIIAISTFITTIFCVCRKSRLKKEVADC